MRLSSHSEAETERLAGALAPWLAPGDVVALEGPLGAGKTRFVSGLARGLAAQARVRSPTFTLVNEYHGRITLLHVDLYRIEERDVPGLALEESLDCAALVVEWAEKLPPALAAEALGVRLTPGAGETRVLDVIGRSARAVELGDRWRRALEAGEAP